MTWGSVSRASPTRKQPASPARSPSVPRSGEITRAPRPRVKVRERPACQHEQSVLDADQIEMWISEPHRPGRKPLTLTPLTTPTARARPIVASSPCRGTETAHGAAPDRPCGVAFPVHCTGATAVQLLPRTLHHVAGARTPRDGRDRQIGLDDDASRAIGLSAGSSASFAASGEAVTPAARWRAGAMRVRARLRPGRRPSHRRCRRPSSQASS